MAKEISILFEEEGMNVDGKIFHTVPELGKYVKQAHPTNGSGYRVSVFSEIPEDKDFARESCVGISWYLNRK